jgi:UDP-2,4-diacetamido-2,4,6-trideoxy-beta-L-altropyranose hydrolase
LVANLTLPLLVIRADATVQIGSGHLMRCLALAEGWQTHGGKVLFIINCESELLQQRVRSHGMEVVRLEHPYPHPSDPETTQRLLREIPTAIVVIDGYHFDSEYHRLLRQEVDRLLVIDDIAHLPFYDADVILNQNIDATHLSYNCPVETRLLLGTRYALLRSEFLAWQTWERSISIVARKLLITMGGSDQYNQTLKVVRALQQLEVEGLSVKAVIGGSNPHLHKLQKFVDDSSVKMELIHNTTNMAELMAWADIAVSGAGTTCWELAFLGLPSVLMVLADNQKGIAEGLNRAGFSFNLGWFEQVSVNALVEKLSGIMADVARRRSMSRCGRELVDGNGAQRVIFELRSMCNFG